LAEQRLGNGDGRLVPQRDGDQEPRVSVQTRHYPRFPITAGKRTTQVDVQAIERPIGLERLQSTLSRRFSTMDTATDVTLPALPFNEPFPAYPVATPLHLVERATNSEVSASDSSMSFLNEQPPETLGNDDL